MIGRHQILNLLQTIRCIYCTDYVHPPGTLASASCDRRLHGFTYSFTVNLGYHNIADVITDYPKVLLPVSTQVALASMTIVQAKASIKIIGTCQVLSNPAFLVVIGASHIHVFVESSLISETTVCGQFRPHLLHVLKQ